MILTLLIKVVEETKQGVSRSTGNAWQSQHVVLEAKDGEGVFRVYAKMYGEMVDRFKELGLGVGQVAVFDLQFSTDEYHGFVSNKVNIVAIHNS